MQGQMKPVKRGFLWEMKHNRSLYLMCVPGLLLLLAFAYLPMGGMYMAFTKYNVVDGIFGSPFVGLENFSYFFNGNPYAWNAIWNTLVINFWGLILGTALPVTLAIFMNELKNGVFKKVSTIFTASSGPRTRPPNATILVSLCNLVASAEKQSEHSAQRIPGILFAAMEMPIPVPHIRIPFSHSPSKIACPTFLA